MYCNVKKPKPRKIYRTAREVQNLTACLDQLSISNERISVGEEKENTPPSVVRLAQTKKSASPERGSLSDILTDRANRYRKFGGKFVLSTPLRENADFLPKKRQKFK